jgi:FkbM family methyltransferase
MRTNSTRHLLTLLTLALLIGGCSDETTTAQTPPANKTAPAKKQKKTIFQQAVEYKEQIRNAPGRTGILTEEKRYSLLDEELIIRDFFQDRKGGFFVDVGCAWPIKASNTYYLEEQLGWTGIGVDALDDYAAGWKEKRPSSKFFSYLVTSTSGGSGAFFKSPDIGLSSMDRDRAAGTNYANKMEPVKIEVPMITLNDLLDREGVEKIDLLSMDIEGHEPEALAGFDIGRFQPELIVIEGDNRAVTKYLNQHGYEQIERYVPFDPINRYFRRKQEAATAGGG